MYSCTSFIDELITDVITNKKEQGWESLKTFIEDKKPKFSLFGDVHQPKHMNGYLKYKMY